MTLSKSPSPYPQQPTAYQQSQPPSGITITTPNTNPLHAIGTQEITLTHEYQAVKEIALLELSISEMSTLIHPRSNVNLKNVLNHWVTLIP